ncbi:MAG: glycosyl hydrolase family 8 [Vicinamibacteria bacterium]
MGARAVAVAWLVTALAAAGCGHRAAGDARRGDRAEALAAAERFLDRYVDADGRVVRRDQGSDTVGEGQAYALLLTAATGDRRRFDRVWRWTSEHLRRRDGLLAHRWAGGRVLDGDAATDADVDTAHALVLGARRFDRPGLRREARRTARAILAHETVRHGRRRTLVAGPWARTAPVVNVSYFDPRAYGRLAALGRRGDWRALRRDAPRTIRRLAGAGRLPPDWARPGPDGRLAPARGADGGPSSAALYGFDAVRVPIRLAAACDRASRRTAARLAPVLRDGQPDRLPRGLDGSTADGAVRHAVALVGVAAAAHARGERALARRLLDDAEALDAAAPTYYGAAWVALGRVLLTTRLLGGC